MTPKQIPLREYFPENAFSYHAKIIRNYLTSNEIRDEAGLVRLLRNIG